MIINYDYLREDQERCMLSPFLCAALPFPSDLSTLLRKPLLSGVLSGSPHGKQGQKSAADLRKVPFLPPSAQSCGQNPKRISHRYR
ncbi:hypothetical protein, partial [Sphingobacterium siyangense]